MESNCLQILLRASRLTQIEQGDAFSVRDQQIASNIAKTSVKLKVGRHTLVDGQVEFVDILAIAELTLINLIAPFNLTLS